MEFLFRRIITTMDMCVCTDACSQLKYLVLGEAFYGGSNGCFESCTY